MAAGGREREAKKILNFLKKIVSGTVCPGKPANKAKAARDRGMSGFIWTALRAQEAMAL